MDRTNVIYTSSTTPGNLRYRYQTVWNMFFFPASKYGVTLGVVYVKNFQRVFMTGLWFHPIWKYAQVKSDHFPNFLDENSNNVFKKKTPPNVICLGGPHTLRFPMKKKKHIPLAHLISRRHHLRLRLLNSQGPRVDHHHPTLLPIDPRKGGFPVTLKKPKKGLKRPPFGGFKR